MNSTLPINRLINVTVNITPNGASIQNINTLLILGSSDVINTVERYRSYTALAQVASDFGTSAPEYLAAVLWFEQTPQPTTLQIGRWAKTATSGKLICASLTVAQQALANWTSITTGSFTISIGGVAKNITALSFAAAGSMTGVAAVIQTALNASVAGTTCVWNSVYSRFEIETAGTTGTASTASFLTAEGTGVDISAQMAGLVTSSGAYIVGGIAAETALACVTLFDNNYGQNWYAVQLLGGVDADYISIAGYIQGTTNLHLQGCTTQEAAVLVAGDTTSLPYSLQQLGYSRTCTQYSSTNAYAVASLLSKALSVNYLANNTVITLMYKQEPGIIPENLNVTQVNAIEAKNCNVFVAYNNNTAIIEQGVMANGTFIDVITGTDWLALTIQTACYNALYTSPTKIPQTDAGTNVLVNAIENVCGQGEINDLLGPGTWNSNGFGSLNTGDFLPLGYYVYAPLMATQLESVRATRASVPIQVAAKLSGAIQTVDVIINVNQ